MFVGTYSECIAGHRSRQKVFNLDGGVMKCVSRVPIFHLEKVCAIDSASAKNIRALKGTFKKFPQPMTVFDTTHHRCGKK